MKTETQKTDDVIDMAETLKDAARRCLTSARMFEDIRSVKQALDCWIDSLATGDEIDFSKPCWAFVIKKNRQVEVFPPAKLVDGGGLK